MNIDGKFSVSAAGRSVAVADGAVLHFWQNAVRPGAWAKYIILTDDAGGFVYGEAHPTFVQADPAQSGDLRVRYEGTVPCVRNARYVQAALGPSINAASAVLRADMDFCGVDEETAVSIRLRIGTTGTDVHFCAGDNPLVRHMLGCGDGALSYALGWGNCDYPARPCARTKQGLTVTPATAAVRENSLRIGTEATTAGCALAVFSDETPLMRALRPVTYTARTVYETGSARRALRLIGSPELVYNVRVDNTALLRTDTCRIYDGCLQVTAGNVRELGVSGEIKSDPQGEYLGLITASYAELYKVDVTEITPVLRVPRNGEHIEVLSGGALGVWATTQLTIYEPDENGEYASFTASVISGQMRALVREGDRYHGLYRRGAALQRVAISRTGEVTILQTKSFTSNHFTLGRCGNALFFGDSEIEVHTLDADLSSEFSQLTCVTSARIRDLVGMGDYFAISNEMTEMYVYDILHDRATNLERVLYANGRVAYSDKEIRVYDFYYGLRLLKGPYPKGNITCACLCGNALFVLAGTALYVYYCFGSASAVRLPANAEGKTVSLNVREKVPAGVDEAAEFCLTLAPAAGR